MYKPLFFLFFLPIFSAHAITLSCENGIHFDSSIPLIEDASFPSPILSKMKVCGLPTTFETSCETNLIQQGEEYNFSWRCDEAYGDLYFTSLYGGYASFRCAGEGVEKPFTQYTYRNCEIF